MKPKPKPQPKRMGRPPAPKGEKFASIHLSVLPEDAVWLASGGNASFKAREVFKAAREREQKKK